jgi:hypothetical protein
MTATGQFLLALDIIGGDVALFLRGRERPDDG